MSEGYLCKESFFITIQKRMHELPPSFSQVVRLNSPAIRRFFFLFRGKKEHPFPSSSKQEGRRTHDLRLSGSQIRHQDALTEKAWEDQRPHRDSILLEVLC